jgi:site-specific DNA-methyltransferase (adenine-specific)/adenine-specific DNA-methyltransferase
VPTQQKLSKVNPNENIETVTFVLPSPQPIKGFPELRWVGKRPFSSTQYYPAQLKERYGDPVDGWMNKIFWGDNLQVMSHLLKEFRGKVDLAYIDPPFASKADYKKSIALKRQRASSDNTSFEEKQYSDIWENDEYIQFIYERLILIRELLSNTGCIFVHCDYRANYLIRAILEEIFGFGKIINEIIWHYTGGGRSKNYFSKKHDSIFWYAKGDDWIFNGDHIRIPYKETSGYAKGGITSQRGKRYEPNPLGTLPDDVWDMPIINPLAAERIGYPTQKPESLLERIILTSSHVGSTVFDCFMGSGTTQAVAMKLGRRFIGADINLGAIQTATKRLNGIIAAKKAEHPKGTDEAKLYLNFEVYNVNNCDVFRNPVQARDLLVRALAIDPLDSTDVFDGMKDGYKVKIMPVNRIASRADLNPILSGINYRELDRNMEKFPGRPAEKIMLVCMGHEPDLAARLKTGIGTQYRLEVKVVDILRDGTDLTFTDDPEARIEKEGDALVIKQFYPRNLLRKLSILEKNVEDWREFVETIAIDWKYDGEVLQPAVYDCPGKNELVKGQYPIPGDHGLIRVKITDLLSESLEQTVALG